MYCLLKFIEMHWIQIFEIQPDYVAVICQHIWPEPDSTMAAPLHLLCMLMMCMMLRNLGNINCIVPMSAIEFVLLLLNIVMHNIGLFECHS